jgi:hypothetical protein
MSIVLPNGAAMIQDSKNKAALLEAWGELLSQYDWDWFMTLTFGKPVGTWAANERFSELVKTIRNDVGHRVEFFRVTDWHRYRPVPHYHCFVGDAGGVSRKKYEAWWRRRYGFARIFNYDKNLGARFYLGKCLTKPDSDLMPSRNLKKILKGNWFDELLRAIPSCSSPKQRLSG